MGDTFDYGDVDSSQEQSYTGDQGQEQGTSGGHPAWQGLLSEIPQDLHPKITPILQEWDRGVNQRFQKVHSEYEAWKPLSTAGVDPELAQYGVNLLNALETNPRQVYEQLQKHFGFDTSQGQGQGESKDQEQAQQDYDPYASKFEQQKQQLDMLSKIMLQKMEAEQAAAEDSALARDLSNAQQKYGDYDEDYVLAKMRTGLSVDDAVKAYKSWEQSKLGQYMPKPLILGSGGGMPGQQMDVTKLSDGDTNKLVAQMLNNANRQSQ